MAVLYREDYVGRPVHIHYETKNTSFLRMVMVLKRMGIQNNLFHLALLQRDLINVDPFDPYIDADTITKILIECKLNPWYFFREIIRIPATGGDAIPFQLHRGNLAAIWSFFNDIDFGLIQPRQTGKTYVIQSIISGVMNVWADNLDIGMFTKDTTLVQDNVSRLKDIRDNLPYYMVKRTSKDWDRKEGISYHEKNNYYKTFTSAIDERGALKLGRGATMGLIHFDEIAFINYNWIVVPTAVNAMIAASENARKAGLPSPVIYTTTAGNPDTKEGSYALSIFESAMRFTEELYDLPNRKTMIELVDKSATRRMLFLEFSYKQLGKSEEWFKSAASRGNASQDDINRDLLNIWQSSTDKSIIPKDLLTKMRENRRDPSFTDLTDDFVVRWYLDRETVNHPSFAKRPLIMGMDTSENVGRDFTTFVIVDPVDLRVVATCRCNESNTIQVARHVTALLLRYTGLVWIPERNNTGVAIIDFVMEQLQSAGINPFKRIYNDVVQNLQDPKYKNINISNYREIFGHTRSAFGFRTSGASTGASRNILYKVTMMKTLEMNHSRLYDRTLINEFSNLTERNGRVDHLPGLHDDTVIAYLLACYLVYFGKNLHLYDIPADTVLSTLTTDGKETTAEIKNEQIRIQRRVRELEEMLAANPSHMLKQSYIRELNTLRPLIDTTIVETKPLAVSQIKFEHERLNRAIGGSPELLLKNFARRFMRK